MTDKGLSILTGYGAHLALLHDQPSLTTSVEPCSASTHRVEHRSAPATIPPPAQPDRNRRRQIRDTAPIWTELWTWTQLSAAEATHALNMSNGTPADPAPQNQALPQALADLINPRWRFTETLPKLTRTNLSTWKCALRLILKQHDLVEFTDTGFKLGQVPASERPFFDKACSSCAALIFASLDGPVQHLIPGTDFEKLPAEITGALEAALKQSSHLVYKLLESEAKALWLTRKLFSSGLHRRSPHPSGAYGSADYPSISDERTIVELMVEARSDHPHYRDLIRTLKFTGVHATIDDFHYCLQEVKDFDTDHDIIRRPQAQGAMDFSTPRGSRDGENWSRRFLRPDNAGRRGRYGQQHGNPNDQHGMPRLTVNQFAQLGQALKQIHPPRSRDGGAAPDYRPPNLDGGGAPAYRPLQRQFGRHPAPPQAKEANAHENDGEHDEALDLDMDALQAFAR